MRITETDRSLSAGARVAEARALCKAKRPVNSDPHRLALDGVRTLLEHSPNGMAKSFDFLRGRSSR